MIGMELESCLEELGMSVAGPFADSMEALKWSATQRPDVAVLDYMLRDGECRALISALKDKSVPIIIHSGWLPDGDVPSDISSLPWVAKPVDCRSLLKVMAVAAPQIIPKSTKATSFNAGSDCGHGPEGI